ncbi:unnamed protein product [Euphydryas editha]|uniref:Uncharacterized protein n=1 Tax=Euphydryas editha TaxID=104508 RepID=A0AAU9TSF3_EUPED|nr:unnamed protein product [Euphydryas editha]CAH2088818.1 unnamed protein product [Euphydryas editha]
MNVVSNLKNKLSHLPHPSWGLWGVKSELKPLGILHKSTDAEFSHRVRTDPVVGRAFKIKLGAFLGIKFASVVAALVTLEAMRKAKTGCFRFEFKGGKLIDMCKVSSCSCLSGGVSTDSTFVKICDRSKLQPEQLAPPSCNESSGPCVRCDYSALPESDEYINPETIPDGIVYSCETPTLAQVFGEVVGKTVSKVEAGVENTVATVGQIVGWILAVLPILGLVVIGVGLFKVFQRLPSDHDHKELVRNEYIHQ